jgi:hypothetical protein
LDRRLSVPQSQTYPEEEKSLAIPGINPQFLDHPAHSLVVLLPESELFRMEMIVD